MVTPFIRVAAICSVASGVLLLVFWYLFAILLPYRLMVVSAQLRLGGFYTRVAPSTVSLLARPRRFLLAVMAARAVLSPPPAAGGCPSTGGRPGRGCWR